MQIVTEVSRYQRNGGSFCVVIPPSIRLALGLVPRDLVVMRLFDDRVVMSRFEPDRQLPFGEARELARVDRRLKAERENGETGRQR